MRYFDFPSRPNRVEYWWAVPGLAFIGIGIAVLDLIFCGRGEAQPLSGLWSLATFIPYLSPGVRRLHDADRIGWWVLAP